MVSHIPRWGSSDVIHPSPEIELQRRARLLWVSVGAPTRGYLNKSPLPEHGSLGRLLGGIGGNLAYFNSFPQKTSLNADGDELQKSDQYRKLPEINSSAIEISLGRAISGVLLGLFLSVFGWKNSYKRKKVFGSTLLGVRWLLGFLRLISLWWMP